MLDHLKQRVLDALSHSCFATLATYGPAGLQAGPLPCEAAGILLYMLLPVTSDHLLNLESRPDVVVTTRGWQLRGIAALLEPTAYPPDLGLITRPEAQWSRLVEIRPTQLHIRRPNGLGFSETIDIDEVNG